MKSLPVFRTFLAAVLVSAGPLFGQDLELAGVQRTLSGPYRASSELARSASFRVRHRSAATSYFVTFSAGNSGSVTQRLASSSSGAALAYQIYDNAAARNVLKDRSTATSLQDVLSGDFPADPGWRQQTLRFVLIVPTAQLPPPGTYTDTISMALFQGTLGSPGAQADQETFTVSIRMPSILQISVVSPGADFDASSTSLNLNFGVLSAGMKRAADLLVRSNEALALSMTSLHGNELQIIHPKDGSFVPISIKINNDPVTVAARTPYAIASSAGPTPYAGCRYALVFEIQDFGMATEGSYSNTIQFTVQAGR